MDEPKNRITDGLVIAVLSAATYWIGFRYEAAFLGSFGIPAHLASVSLSTLLVCALAMLGALWLFVLLGNFFALFWPEHPALQEKVARAALYGFVIGWRLVTHGPRAEDWLHYVSLLTFFLIFEILWPIFVFKEREACFRSS